MAFISYGSLVEGSVLEAFAARYRGADGVLDNILAIHGLNPRSMKDHAELYGHLMRGPSPLSRVQREMIAIMVSTENDCFY